MPTQAEKIRFDQVDVYFYKFKSTAVGIKARFDF